MQLYKKLKTFWNEDPKAVLYQRVVATACIAFAMIDAILLAFGVTPAEPWPDFLDELFIVPAFYALINWNKIKKL